MVDYNVAFHQPNATIIDQPNAQSNAQCKMQLELIIDAFGKCSLAAEFDVIGHVDVVVSCSGWCSGSYVLS